MTPAAHLVEGAPLGPALEDPSLLALLAALLTLAAALLLSRLARVLGLEDRGGGHGLHREVESQPKSLVGGLALCAGLALWQFLEVPAAALDPRQVAFLLLAAAVGLIDDRSRLGLGARSKFLLQCLPAAAYAASTWPAVPWEWTVAALLAALSAQNLANTWDNADGVLLSTAAAALCVERPAWGLMLFALLLCNLRPRGVARILLGDSGSHLIALLVLCEPRAVGAFVLPGLDLARVVLVRRREGRPFWRGDRAHLAHRLQARGASAPAVAGLLLAASLPAILGFALGPRPWGPWAGAGATVLLFLALLRGTPDVDGRGVPRVSSPETRSAPRS